MKPGPAALCPGRVWHKRLQPTEHEFTYDTHHVWIDPDRPDELCALSRWWSATGPAPVRFRAADYGRTGTDPSSTSLGQQVRDDLGPVLGWRPTGEVRMLTQLRRWGWLFNPITVYVAWDAANPDHPVGAVLEVTNTPWHERHRYAVALDPDPGPGHEPGGGDSAVKHWVAEFDKVLHVSPFLDEDHRYRLAIDDRDDAIVVALDVSDTSGAAVLRTGLTTERHPADSTTIRNATLRPVLPTHRVSLGIHVQAARLLAKGVPFVAHPDKRRERPKPEERNRL